MMRGTGAQLVRMRITHHRFSPIRHQVRFRGYLWLVDVASIPRARWFAAIVPRDHFGGQADSIVESLGEFLRTRGEAVRDGERVLMMTNARVAGHVFNPLTTYFGVASDGRLRWVVLEIHNTYGERHAHLLHPDRHGRAMVAKEFYVSPFFPVSGEYAVVTRLERDRVVLSITLRENGIRRFTATLVGDRVPATRARLLTAMAATPLITYQVSTRIRIHGIWLWLRRLPVQIRPPHTPPEGFR